MAVELSSRIATRVAGTQSGRVTVSLSGVSNIGEAVGAEAHVWRPGRYYVLAAVLDTVEETVEVSLNGWLNLITVSRRCSPEEWDFEVEVRWAGSPAPTETFPSGDPLTIAVRASGETP